MTDLRLVDYRPVRQTAAAASTAWSGRASRSSTPTTTLGRSSATAGTGVPFPSSWRPSTRRAWRPSSTIDVEQRAGLAERIARYGRQHPSRFVHFTGLAYDAWAERPDFGEMEAQRLEEAAGMGARGIKVWKPLGLRARDPQGHVVAVDDERLDPFWAMAARLDLPVVVHVADPIAFFDPLDERNERWEELDEHPDWHFWPPMSEAGDEAGFAAFDEILAAFDRVIGRHPETTFIGAHVGCASEDLALVSSMLDRHPNYHVDISARMAELGRQPYTARAFFLRHADRILFGTDLGYDPEMYRLHYRFLETMDESFDYSTEEVPPQGRWQICGLGLPDDVLRKVYADNARRLILDR